MNEEKAEIGSHLKGFKEKIKQGEYEENEEIKIPMFNRLCDRYDNSGIVMPQEQFDMYRVITKSIKETGRYALKKTVCDVGCGLGIGSNILSQEAKFVWGIDKNKKTIGFAKQMYSRDYQPQVTFDEVDITDFKREPMKFDMIVAIELIEHVKDYKKAMDFIKRLCKPNSVVYISSPNRNAPTIDDSKPKNKYHVREWTAAEFYDVMINNFKVVMLYKWDLSEDVDLDTKYTPLLVECREIIQ